MYKKLFFVVFLFLSLTSCDLFFSKKQDVTIKNKTIKPVDFTQVDAYPLLPECENISSRALQKQCFYTQLSKKIAFSLTQNTLNFTVNNTDTIFVKLQVSKKGKLVVSSIISSDNNQKNNQILDSLIKRSVNQISPIKPAIKMGIPVTTEFTLPIIKKGE